MFAGDLREGEQPSRADLATRLEQYKAEINKSVESSARGEFRFDPQTKSAFRPGAKPAITMAQVEAIEKAVGAMENASALSQELVALRSQVEQINKDWTPTSPVGGTGLTAYDLEAPAKVLVPTYTPLRNSIPRTKGIGASHKFKRIDSWSNAGISGGAATLSPFFSSATQTATFGGPGNLTLNRPQKIAYTGSDWSIGYVELGFSDSVGFQTQFQGLGFDDVRGLSQTALLWSHLMGEERAALYARGGTGLGYSGSVSAPGSVTTGTATTGGTIAANTYYVYVVANTGFGNSAPSTVTSQVTTGAASTITVTVGTEPTGAINYGLYVGTVTGIANTTLQATFVGNTYTLTSYAVGATVGVATDSSFSNLAYDGFLTVQSDPTKTGYLRRVNAAWSTTAPGTEIDLALATMYVANGADPDEIYMTGALRQSYNATMRAGNGTGAASGYRTSVVSGDGSVTMGTVVSGQLNPNTGKVVDIKTHRFMPNGAVLIRSTSLPIQNSHVDAPVKFVNVQDYMSIAWPTIQMTYDESTYQIGTMQHTAPAWSGLLLGVYSTSTAGV